MTVAIKICYSHHVPVDRKSWPEAAANVNVVVEIPDRCLARARIAEHIVRVTVAVKIAEDGSRRSLSYDCGTQSVHCNALVIIASRADNGFYRRAKPVTVPRQRAIAHVYEAIGTNYVSGDIHES